MNLGEYASYTGFNAEDRELLRAFAPAVEPHLESICQSFYDAAMAHPATRAVLQDEAQVNRLMRTLKVWMMELLQGPCDDAYAERRRRIGEVHVQVGVPHGAMFAAMQRVRDNLMHIACTTDLPPLDLCRAIDRATQLDLLLMTARFQEKTTEHYGVSSQHLLVSNLPAIVLLIDVDGKVVSYTPAFKHRFKGALNLGMAATDVLPPALVKALDLPESLEHIFRDDRTITLPQIEVPERDETLIITATLGPLRQEHRLALLHLEDHTQAVRTEALLHRQEHLARLGTLSATIAHELRNPLAGISGALQIIRRGMPEDNRYSPVMGKVLDQVQSLNRLVSDLLAFARPRSPEFRDDVDLEALVWAQIDLLRESAPTRRFTVEGEKGLRLSTDPDMFRQILGNLLLNGVQATGENGRVAVILESASMVVEDDGPGVLPEMRSHLFEPFHTSKTHGTGLGLPVSRQMAEALGGRLECVSAQRLRGAAFRFSFHEGS